MKLSKEEKDLIIKFREKNDFTKKVCKNAILKHDLYKLSWINDVYDFDCELLTKNDLDNLIAGINNTPIELATGSEFVCLLKNKKEEWYDNVGYGLAYQPTIWAQRHLINIKDLVFKEKT